jgi:ubiquinone/menaquinone biosynthesis C-methylase UbiE
MKRSPCVLLLFALVLSHAWADYRQDLIAKYPFYHTAVGKFAPVYPALAQQIVQDYGITQGICVDMGGGCGSLAMALARITGLRIYVLDIDPSAVRLCGMLVDEAGLTGHVLPVEGDAQDMPFRDNFADLIISRGYIFFWPDQLAGLREARRVLKPGGVAYLGGGFSRILAPGVRAPLVAERKAAMEAKEPKGPDRKPIHKGLVEQARQAGIQPIRLLHESDDSAEFGWWIEIRK